ncbi:hypothetical protein [Bradyrhizobium sp. NP1]|uniref:hypothetical protein n=1 Tax=Bradyrhizobium sp. NP1 TaxID=3049772 RepID=UPI0025A5DA76|nr:hypothetical protein [Bradyrhizobium sp. NP1]WJR80427.1 hypothetical protein QOU61_11910 [Bradyrhizobium sp. NP1]
MKSLLVTLLATLVSMTTASAQTAARTGADEAASAFDSDPIIEITTTFRARIDGLADPREVPSPTAQDAARRTLYNMAANECTVLSEFWKAECRLSSFFVAIGRSDPEPPQFPSMFGTAVYELRPKPH